MQFFGFTKVPVDSFQNILSKTADHAEEFALVFDYADKGTIQDYLRQALVPGSARENWKTICGMLNEVSIGLQTIHSRDIVHR